MIANPARIYEGCPPGTVQMYKLRLVDHFLLQPLGEAWDVRVTSAYRSQTAQSALYALDDQRSGRKAKGVSQHSLGEAVDVVTEPVGHLLACFEWCLKHLRPWQAILEYAGTRPECIHLSLPSEVVTIQAKRLLWYDGRWLTFEGQFPQLVPA